MTQAVEQNEIISAQQTGMVQQAPQRDLLTIDDNSEFAGLLDTRRFEHAQRVAKIFSSSALVPQHFQGNMPNCFIAIQMAIRMKVDPFMFMQNTYIVHGRPGMEAKLAIALINSSGLFQDSLDYEIDGDNPKDAKYRVRAFAVRKSTGKTVYGPWVDWDVVKAERWDQKDGSKWKTIPGLMFQYRAATFFGRLHCPERLMGMQMVDEIDDVGQTREVQSHVVESGLSPLGQRIMADTPKLEQPKQEPKAPPQDQPAAPEPTADTDAAEKWLVGMWELAEQQGSKKGDFDKAINRALLKVGLVGKLDKTDAEWRKAMETALREKSGFFAYLSA